MSISAASVAIIDDGKVLLIKRALPPFQGFWTLPGGRLEQDEDIKTAAKREIHEELGLSLTDLTPITVLDLAGPTPYRLAVFAAAHTAETPRLSDEIADWRWARAPDLLRLETTPGLAAIVATALSAISPSGK